MNEEGWMESLLVLGLAMIAIVGVLWIIWPLVECMFDNMCVFK